MIVNNGAIMRVKVRNDQMISGQWLKSGETVMIPNNKAVKELEEAGVAEVIKWRKRKVPDSPAKVGPTENTALKPKLETASKSIVISVPKITKEEAKKARPGVPEIKKKAPAKPKKRR